MYSGNVGVAVRAAVVDHFLIQEEHELTPELLRFVREMPVGVDAGSGGRHRDVLRGERRRDEGENTRDGALPFVAAPELVVHGVEDLVREFFARLQEIAVVVDGELCDRLHPVFGEEAVHHPLPARHGFLAGTPERTRGLPLEAGRELGRRRSGGEGARDLRRDSRSEDRRDDPDAQQTGEGRPGPGTLVPHFRPSRNPRARRLTRPASPLLRCRAGWRGAPGPGERTRAPRASVACVSGPWRLTRVPGPYRDERRSPALRAQRSSVVVSGLRKRSNQAR